jgi:hypothetical protein
MHAVVVRLAKYYAEIIPLALRVMLHPAFNLTDLARLQPGGPAVLHQALSKRLDSLIQRRRMAKSSPLATARLLTSLAHDWALGNVLAPGRSAHGVRELKKQVNIVWEGLRP